MRSVAALGLCVGLCTPAAPAPVLATDRPPAITSMVTSADGEAAWTRVPAPVLSDERWGTLEGVACPADDVCIAVGAVTPDGNRQALAARWDGTAWSPLSMPLSMGGESFTESELHDITCMGVDYCVAVGSYLAGADHKTLVATFDGDDWSVVGAGNVTGRSTQLRGVSCWAQDACVAVGESWGGALPSTAILESSIGGWRIDGSINGGADSTYLAGLSCSGPGACVAVGSRWDGFWNRPLAASFNGTEWLTLDVTELPSTAALGDVSCLPGVCTVVGATAGSGTEAPFVATWQNAEWRVQEVPDPDLSGSLRSVDCVTRDRCVSVGMRRTNPFSTLGVASDPSWGVEATHDPDADGSRLVAVACAPGGACLAVGDYREAGRDEMLVEERSAPAPAAMLTPAIGPWYGGNSVTLRGTGLAGVTTVSFGVQEVEPDLVTDTMVSVTVPARVAPTAAARVVPVTLRTRTSLLVAGTYAYRGAAVFLLRGLNTHLPGGIPDTWPSNVRNGDSFYQPDGLVDYLTAHGWPEDVFLNYSYKGGSWTAHGWEPLPYAALFDSWDALVDGTRLHGSIPALDGQILSYLGSRPDTDIYLVGHSQGGVIAMGYLAHLRTSTPARPPDTLGAQAGGTGRIAGVITLDSPIGGLNLHHAREICVLGAGLLASGPLDASTAARCRQPGYLENLPQLDAIRTSATGDPWGSTRSIERALFPGGTLANQSLADWAAARGTRILTVANRADWVISFGTLGGVSTQWLVESGETPARGAIHAKVIERSARPFLMVAQVPLIPDLVASHGVVLTDAEIQHAVLQAMSGEAPLVELAADGPRVDRSLLTGTSATAARSEVTGIVRGQSGAPIGDVWAMAISVGYGVSQAQQTTADGRYSLPVPDGTYKIAFIDPLRSAAVGYWSPSGYVATLSMAGAITVEGAPVHDIDVALPFARSISGEVVDPTGRPAANLAVVATTTTGELVANAVTSADGRWALDVPTGDYLIAEFDPGGTWSAGYLGATGTVATVNEAMAVVVGSADVEGIELVARRLVPAATLSPLPTWTMSTDIPLAWSATTEGAPISSYDVRYRRARWDRAFGGYTTWRSATTAVTGRLSGARGFTYCVSVRARDTMGEVSGWTTESCTALPLNDRALSRSGPWTSLTGTGYYAGTAVRSSRGSAALAKRGAVARRVAVVATTCPSCGKIRVFWGSRVIGTINLRSRTIVHRRVLPVTVFTRPRTGTVRIQIVSGSGKVIIEGLALRAN